MTGRIQELVETVRDGSPDIWEAAQELSGIATDLAVSLIALLHAEQPETRAAAAYVLGAGRFAAARVALEETLDSVDEQPGVRGQVAEALGSIGAPQSIDVLIKHLSDTRAEVTFWCTYALGQIGDLKAIPALLKLAETVGERSFEQHSLREEALDAAAEILGLVPPLTPPATDAAPDTATATDAESVEPPPPEEEPEST
jgi:HEAT repeat protein